MFRCTVQTVVTLANFGDLAAVVIASQVDKKTDPRYIPTLINHSLAIQAQLALLNKFVGAEAATPEATAAG